MLTASGDSLNLEYADSSVIPSIGDHVVFFRAGGEYGADGKSVSKVKQVQGIVENRTFQYFTEGTVEVNAVVTDSKRDWGDLIKM